MKKAILKILFMLLMPATVLAGQSADISIMVTPVVTVSLSASVTSYNFGALSVGTSSNTVTAIMLTNDGTVGVTVEKTVWDDDGWDITKSSSEMDGFDLWAMTKSTDSARPGLADFTSTHRFTETALQLFNDLTNCAGTVEDLDPDEKASLWLRLDMPKKVSTSQQQTIHIRLKATGKSNAVPNEKETIEYFTREVMKLLEKAEGNAIKEDSNFYNDVNAGWENNSIIRKLMDYEKN